MIKSRTVRALVASALVPLAFAASMDTGSARGVRKRTRTLAPGVTFTRIKDPSGPYAIKIIDVDLAGPSTIDVALAGDALPGFETTSSMASRHGALAAINGDYARPSGRPVFAFAEDGVLAQTPLMWGRNFSVSTDETTTYIGHPFVSAWAYEQDLGYLHTLDTVNAGAPSDQGLAAFTSAGGREERPPTKACSARVRPSEPPHARLGDAGVEARGVVEKVRCSGERLFPKGATVLSAPIGGARASEVSSLLPGEEVSLGWSLGWTGVMDTIGGNPTLIENGAIVDGNVYGSGSFFKRHPRTGVGTTADNHVLLVTVDGREPGHSVGMTLDRFASLFASLGADWALNLDGGGSTTSWVRGRVKNRPSDGYERAVSSALLVLPGADPGEPGPYPAPSPTPSGVPSPIPSPLPTPSPSQVAGRGSAYWNAIAADPASTGGLLRALRADGVRIPVALLRALRMHR